MSIVIYFYQEVKKVLGSRLVRCVRDLIQSRLYVSKVGF